MEPQREMRARKRRSAPASAVAKWPPEEREIDLGETEAFEEGASEKETGFFGCYLLASLSPRHKGRTYIGFTVNPRRRIRQHNGEIRCGAWRTKNGRPWEMVLCIYGFPSNVSALQFEWAWQHPRESLAVRKAASSFKSLSGIANKIKIAYTMLLLPSWENLNLTVNFFSTKYMKHTAGCPKLPKKMKTVLCIVDELPCYVKGPIFDDHIEEEVDDGDDDNSENEGPISPCLDALVDQVEKDARNGIDTWNMHDDFLLELESSSTSMESSKATSDSAVSNSTGKILLNDLNIWGDFDGIRKPIGTTEFPCCVVEDSSTSTGTTEVLCSDDGFDFLAGSSLERFNQRWTTPRCSNKKASTDCLLLSPENNVIDLVSPPNSLVISCKNKKTPIHVDVIDLTDSPISI